MNIFVLDRDINKCVQMYVDAHVRKMHLEAAEMLCHAASVYGVDYAYGESRRHPRHPCTIWTCESRANFLWLWRLGMAIHREWIYRYGTMHKTGMILRRMPIQEIMMEMPDTGLTPFAHAFGPYYDLCHDEDDVTAYRRYYANAKTHLFTWSKRKPPEWVTNKTYEIPHEVIQETKTRIRVIPV